MVYYVRCLWQWLVVRKDELRVGGAGGALSEHAREAEALDDGKLRGRWWWWW